MDDGLWRCGQGGIDDAHIKRERLVQALPLTKDDVLNRLLVAHEAWYNVSRNHEFAGRTFPGYAEFHTMGEQYVLVKRAKLWGVTSHEYIFFVEVGDLDVAQLSELIDFMKTDAVRKVDPTEPDHMQSFISLVVIADSADPEALKLTRKTRFRKNFKLGFNGFADLRLAVVDLGSMSVVTNGMGKDMKRSLEANLKAPATEPTQVLQASNAEAPSVQPKPAQSNEGRTE